MNLFMCVFLIMVNLYCITSQLQTKSRAEIDTKHKSIARTRRTADHNDNVGDVVYVTVRFVWIAETSCCS